MQRGTGRLASFYSYVLVVGLAAYAADLAAAEGRAVIAAESPNGTDGLGGGAQTSQRVISRQELHRWERHVRGFRQEHHFALTMGASSGVWQVRRLGTMEERKFDNSGGYGRLQYSFHLPIYRGFGYMLGSSTGYHYESTDRRRPFQPVPAVQFPGVLVGLVYNFNPVFRWAASFDAYLERHEGIEERDGVGEDPKISVTMECYDVGTYFDIFYQLNWAVRIEVHRRELHFQRPGEADGFAVNANLRKKDQWLGVGLVYHLL